MALVSGWFQLFASQYHQQRSVGYVFELVAKDPFAPRKSHLQEVPATFWVPKSYLLWMDEILHHLRNLAMMIPL